MQAGKTNAARKYSGQYERLPTAVEQPRWLGASAGQAPPLNVAGASLLGSVCRRRLGFEGGPLAALHDAIANADELQDRPRAGVAEPRLG